MSDDGREAEAVIEYERTLTEVADRQAVDEAEDAVARAWIAELDDMRREGLRLAMAVRVAERVAREKLRKAQQLGHPHELAKAHAKLAATQAETKVSLGHANALLCSVDAELEAVCQAGMARTRRNEQDLRRLRSAWTAAYGRS
ncbi:hypothetical protein KDK95_17030 [Actinospica sp. MGRD01-02]|uniref:Uncharacterized protein n=1 Tax=Actinospica acidithermotolerans TaxID=2828514 RepID=A0A941ECD6_9ACTN|nr:hypothetical protein [Actinospica acidithermotolerans]MBR7828023.1 hypothetical protein [Actinospica acidithermotolerans]